MFASFGRSSVHSGSGVILLCVGVQASMLEIYNEEYKDLLSKSLPAGKKHQVRCPCQLPNAKLSALHPRTARSIVQTVHKSPTLVFAACSTALPWHVHKSCACLALVDIEAVRPTQLGNLFCPPSCFCLVPAMFLPMPYSSVQLSGACSAPAHFLIWATGVSR